MLAAQTRVGIARAQWFPSLALTARGGGTSADLGSLLASGAQAWSVGALLAGTLFDGGRRSANTARARADLDRSFAEYRGAVLAAFQDVETQLSALQTLDRERAERERAVAAYARAALIARTQYRDGETGQLELLDTQRNELTARRRLVQIVGAQHQATALLIRALGGDWPAPVSSS
jgi:multidrug efflux system outer membrane protein